MRICRPRATNIATLYDSANEGLFRISGEGVLIRANPTLARILGFDSTEALLADYRDLLDRVFLKKDRAQETDVACSTKPALRSHSKPKASSATAVRSGCR